MSTIAIANPSVGIAEEGNASLQRQLISCQRYIDVVIAAILRVVDRTLPLVWARLAPALEDPQANDRPVPEARILVGLVRHRLALLVVWLADPDDGAAQPLLGCRAPRDLHPTLALVRGPQAEDALVLREGGTGRHEQGECACGRAYGKHVAWSSSLAGIIGQAARERARHSKVLGHPRHGLRF